MTSLPGKPVASGSVAAAIYLAVVVLTSPVSALAWSVALIAELLLVAWLASSGRLGKRGLRALAVLGLLRFLVLGAFALFSHPVSAVLGGQTPSQLVSFVNGRMVVAAGEVLWSLTPGGVLIGGGLAVLLAVALQARGRGGWPRFIAAAGIIPLMAFVEPIEFASRRMVSREALATAAGVGNFELDASSLSSRTSVGAMAADGVPTRVVLVMLESVGAHNLSRYLERHPDGRFSRVLSRGLYFERVLSVANASHMAQPAVLTSEEFSQGVVVGNAKLPRRPPQGWGFAEHFENKGWVTLMQSSQDESWLQMNEITMGESWRQAGDARDESEGRGRYRDACGTGKLLDSVTLQSFDALLRGESVPLFAYLNLQNTHYPYVVESDGAHALLSELTCANQHVMPAWKLMLARRQYDRALDESLERVAQLIEDHPDTLFVLTGDHGESMLPGESFGHAHQAIPEQMETFALFVGPGVEPLREKRSISSLDLLPTTIAIVSPQDLELLPQDMLQGIDARTYGDRRRVQLSVSYGLQPTSYAVDVDGVWLQLTAEKIHCQDRAGETLDVERCRLNRDALAHWLSCKTAFYAQADHARWYEPCWRLTREKFSRPDVATLE